MTTAHVELRSIDKWFGPTKAVDGLTLDVQKGSFTTLLGPSGCGKTTTLRMLAGFHDPDAGEILIGGRGQKGIPPHRRNVSIVFQDYALFPHMTVLGNVGYGLRLKRVTVAERRRRVERVLDFLDLTRLAGRHPHELSGGQQQRVALGRSIVMEPEVLLMDEPLSNLDAKLRLRVRAELKQIQRQLGITTIYVTHDQDEALSLSDRVAVMDGGRLQQYSDPWELYHAPANRFVADFVGQANFLPAQVVASSDGQATVALGSQRLRCANPNGLAPSADTVAVMVRPEWLEAVAPDAGEAAPGVELAGRVVAGSFLGSHIRLWVSLADGSEVVVDTPVSAKERMEAGTEVRLRLADGRAVAMS